MPHVKAAKTCRNQLADIFSMDIIYHDDDGNKTLYKKDSRVFATPLEIKNDEDDIHIMYTKGQARLFAGGKSEKSYFSKETAPVEEKSSRSKKSEEELNSAKKDLVDIARKLAQSKGEQKEAEDEVERLKIQLESFKSYKDITNTLSSVLGDFVKAVINYLKAIKDNAGDNAGYNFTKEKDKLLNSMFFTVGLETDRKIQKLCGDFSDSIASLQNQLTKADPSRTLERLKFQKEEVKQVAKRSCKECDRDCDYYEGIKVECGDILDGECLEK